VLQCGVGGSVAKVAGSVAVAVAAWLCIYCMAVDDDRACHGVILSCIKEAMWPRVTLCGTVWQWLSAAAVWQWQLWQWQRVS
jgi:hypothetical protein